MSRRNSRGTIFQYLKETLIPTLRPDDTMVMDNLRIHLVKAVREVLETAGIVGALPDAISRVLSLISPLDCQLWFDAAFDCH